MDVQTPNWRFMEPGLRLLATISLLFLMLNKPRVVSMKTNKPKLVAMDEQSRRYILQIGADRVAFDYTLHATKLPPTTGDEPAAILPMRNGNRKRTRRKEDRI